MYGLAQESVRDCHGRPSAFVGCRKISRFNCTDIFSKPAKAIWFVLRVVLRPLRVAGDGAHAHVREVCLCTK